jgi:hypothetical protein
MVKPKCFYTRFGEEWKAVEKYDKAKVELQVVNWGTLQGLVIQFLSFPRVSEDKAASGGHLLLECPIFYVRKIFFYLLLFYYFYLLLLFYAVIPAA